MNLILLGGPGSGKGTQADALKARFGLLHLSSGNLFRQNIKERTPLGLEAETYINLGNLVPDEITIAMLGENLKNPEAAGGVILDGFPRTLAQARALSDLMAEMDRTIDGVISIRVSEDEIVQRLSGRLVCRECETTFHKDFRPFVDCPFNKCEGEHLFRRRDDDPDTIRERLRVFNALTAPLIEFYQEAGLLVNINGEGPITEVTKTILKTVERIKVS